jgi:hypothetical protein
MRRNRFCICLTLLFILQTASIAQEKSPQTRDQWMIRAERLTDDLIKDAETLSPYGRALLFAGLGETWWEVDRERARAFFNKAVELAKAQPGSESAGRRYPFATAHAVFSILVRYDKVMSDELMKLFLGDQENQSEQDRNQNAQAIAGVATKFMPTDPKRALEIGLASLRVGASFQILSLIWNFSERDIKSAELLFKEALAVARSRNDTALLNILAQAAYQGIGNPTKKQIVSDRLCAEMLNLIADFLLQIPTARPLKSSDCSIASIAARLIGEFDRLLPARAAAVREAIVRCQPVFDSFQRKETESYFKSQPLKTAEDYLKAAEGGEDSILRFSLQMRAASMSASEKDYEQAIKILDSMTVPPNTSIVASWKSARQRYAGQLAIEHIRLDRIDLAQQVIAMTPDDLQGSVCIEVAGELFGRKNPNAIDFIREARIAMARADLSSQTLREYMSLVSLYEARLPAEAIDMLNEAVAAINRAWQMKRKETAAEEYEVNWLIGGVSDALFERDEAGVRAAFSSIEDPVRRVSMRHRALRSILLKYRARQPVTRQAKQ